MKYNSDVKQNVIFGRFSGVEAPATEVNMKHEYEILSRRYGNKIPCRREVRNLVRRSVYTLRCSVCKKEMKQSYQYLRKHLSSDFYLTLIFSKMQIGKVGWKQLKC
jgi:hypothetical protein